MTRQSWIACLLAAAGAAMFLPALPLIASQHAASSTASGAVAAGPQSQSTGAPPPKPAKHDAQAQDGDDGGRIFKQNCSRCHAAPQGFSPRIAGTVVRHMRVRASLSATDEQKLLRFFNP